MASTSARAAARSDPGLPSALCEDELRRTSGAALHQGHPHRGLSGDLNILSLTPYDQINSQELFFKTFPINFL